VLLRDRLAFDVGLKIALLTVLIAAVNIAWLMSGALLTRFFREPRSNRVINVVFALLLLASVPLAIAW
jgi:threonine/homoserine/homoserine lactone efflux protein